MAQSKDKNYVSVWWWLWSLFVVSLPCFGIIMVVWWAFRGENQSRKNYFRALIVVFLFWVGLWALLVALGAWPEIAERIGERLKPAAPAKPARETKNPPVALSGRGETTERFHDPVQREKVSQGVSLRPLGVVGTQHSSICQIPRCSEHGEAH